MAVNGTHGLEREKKHTQTKQINPVGSWWYIEGLKTRTIGLCKKLNSIYIVSLHCPTVLSTFTTAAWDAASSSSCFTADRRLISALTATYLSNGPLTLIIKIVDRCQWSIWEIGGDRRLFRVFRPQCIITSHRVLTVYVCFFLSQSRGSHWLPYMTDRLQCLS